jgi:hypothetical protein
MRVVGVQLQGLTSEGGGAAVSDVTAAGTETRAAVAQNKLYGLLADDC